MNQPTRKSIMYLFACFIALGCLFYIYQRFPHSGGGSSCGCGQKTTEGFSLSNAGDFPISQTERLLQDSFPITDTNGISAMSADQMWWRYPTFQLGSFEQITNNMKHQDNPDNATCTASTFCYALYKNATDKKSNNVYALPPVTPATNESTRVGYFLASSPPFL